jgi:hypothetical protein
MPGVLFFLPGVVYKPDTICSLMYLLLPPYFAQALMI